MTSRKPPGPLGRRLARAPIVLYRVGLGWLLGRRFTMIEHVGRVSGRRHCTVLEVIDHDDSSIAVAAAWGPESDWFRNLTAEPSARVWTGTRRAVPASASVLPVEDGAAVFDRYRAAHPRAARMLGRTLGIDLDEPAKVASVVPVVRLTLE